MVGFHLEIFRVNEVYYPFTHHWTEGKRIDDKSSTDSVNDDSNNDRHAKERILITVRGKCTLTRIIRYVGYEQIQTPESRKQSNHYALPEV